MALPLNLSPDEIHEVFSQAIKSSAVLGLCAPRLAPVNKDSVYFTSSYSDASFRTLGNETPVEDGAFGKFTVHMGTMSKAIEHYAIDAEDAPALIAETKKSLPLVLARTFDRAFFKDLVPTSPYDVAGIAELPVDETPESWQAVVDHINSNGYNPTGMVLDNSMKVLVRRACSEGVIGLNPLSVNPTDGFLIAGVPVYFRDLSTANGSARHGLIADFTQVATAHTGLIDSTIWGKKDSPELQRRGVTQVISEYRIGAGIADKKAVATIVAAPAA
jgi:hypothetical protein